MIRQVLFFALVALVAGTQAQDCIRIANAVGPLASSLNQKYKATAGAQEIVFTGVSDPSITISHPLNQNPAAGSIFGRWSLIRGTQRLMEASPGQVVTTTFRRLDGVSGNTVGSPALTPQEDDDCTVDGSAPAVDACAVLPACITVTNAGNSFFQGEYQKVAAVPEGYLCMYRHVSRPDFSLRLSSTSQNGQPANTWYAAALDLAQYRSTRTGVNQIDAPWRIVYYWWGSNPAAPPVSVSRVCASVSGSGVTNERLPGSGCWYAQGAADQLITQAYRLREPLVGTTVEFVGTVNANYKITHTLINAENTPWIIERDGIALFQTFPGQPISSVYTGVAVPGATAPTVVSAGCPVNQIAGVSLLPDCFRLEGGGATLTSQSFTGVKASFFDTNPITRWRGNRQDTGVEVNLVGNQYLVTGYVNGAYTVFYQSPASTPSVFAVSNLPSAAAFDWNPAPRLVPEPLCPGANTNSGGVNTPAGSPANCALYPWLAGCATPNPVPVNPTGPNVPWIPENPAEPWGRWIINPNYNPNAGGR